MGHFTPQQPEVNWRNPELRNEIYSVLRFWLDKGVDGFRLDVANYYVKDDQMRDNPRALTCPGHLFINHLYDRDRPETKTICKEMRDICNSYPGDRMMIGEIFADCPSVPVMYQGHNDMLNLSYNFDFLY